MSNKIFNRGIAKRILQLNLFFSILIILNVVLVYGDIPSYCECNIPSDCPPISIYPYISICVDEEPGRQGCVQTGSPNYDDGMCLPFSPHNSCYLSQCVYFTYSTNGLSGVSSGECVSNSECTHKVCQYNDCVSIGSPGTDECETDDECFNPINYEVCDGATTNNQGCVPFIDSSWNGVIDPPNEDLCSSTLDCRYASCAGYYCIEDQWWPGPEPVPQSIRDVECQDIWPPWETIMEQSIPDPDCGHTECNAEHECVIVEGSGEILCMNDEDCWDYSYVVNFTYDNGCLNNNDFAFGKLCRINDLSGSNTYGYDERGRITKQLITINDEETYEIDYEYNSADMLINEILPNDLRINYNYNNLGQLENIKIYDEEDNLLNELSNYEYNPTGTISNVGFGNEVDTAYTYTSRDWLYTLNTEGGAGNIFNRKYNYDNVGNLRYLKQIDDTQLAEYQYDNLYRLTDVLDNNYYPFNDLHFTYDAVGNRLTKTTDSSTLNYVYPNSNNKLECVSGSGSCITSNLINLEYDLVGNQISKTENGETLNFNYDYDNMVERVNFEDGSYEEYIYNYNNQRVKKIDKEGYKTIYIYDMNGNMVYEESEEETCSGDDFSETTSKFRIQDSNGQDILAMDENGVMLIKGNLIENELGNPIGSNNFMVEDEQGNIKIWMDNNGNLHLKGSLQTFIESLEQTSNKELVIQDSNSGNIALFDGNTGNLKLKSCLAENINVQDYI